VSPDAKRNTLIVVFATLLMAVVTASRAESTVHIIETQPATDATLGHGQSFYVRIGYSSDEPISLWARPFFHGKEVNAMSNPSWSYSGTGEALGWFELSKPGEVDEIRVKAGGGKPYHEWEVLKQPVQLRWSDAEAASGPRAPWVEALIAAESARSQEEAQRRANEPTPVGAAALMSGFMLCVLALLIAGVAVPLWSVWKWHGGWKIAAAVPAAVIGFVVLRIVVDTSRDPTSHNLWPFEILQFGVVALVIIGILKVARRFMGVQS
jgi:hypothetical protein